MDSLQIKFVLNEVQARLERCRALPNFDQHSRGMCKEVAILLLQGEAGYERLNIAANHNHQGPQSDAHLAAEAVSHASQRWNAEMERLGKVGFDLNPQEIARFIQDVMTGYEVYFVDHQEKVAKYGDVYGDIDAILDANPDVEAMGEPGEIAPIPASNGRIGCALCGTSLNGMAVLESHNEAIHLNRNMSACTECTWTRGQGRPNDIIDHLQSEHDIYSASHPDYFSTNINHIGRKNKTLLRTLLREDRHILASLRGNAPPVHAIPPDWSKTKLARDISSTRRQIKHQAGWRAIVDGQRVDRIAQ
ncbi:hypothetical protein J7T55_015495 [Diaporthe amygdali]|uniref:uncharacterized protein n=1 Tax=Phomopsis amygdali TaxID=1214568 RepID=UPI0022FE31C0|nr:uncharacterized protein J7T55_015495 [Diaporthe amygdali]KAJ0120762.1 hypothetical protein J7T55_015495 [Diaporthe amygdali]